MRNRIAVLAVVVAAAAAATSTIHAQSNEITTTGTVVSKSATSLVVRIDDHRHRIAFDLDAATKLPDSLAAGQRVSIVYHPTGSTGQKADTVTRIEPARAKPGA
jgi:nitrate reductase NapAB chaperone NapD